MGSGMADQPHQICFLSVVCIVDAALDSNTQMDVAYFDFRKAFNMVDNDVPSTTKTCQGRIYSSVATIFCE